MIRPGRFSLTAVKPVQEQMSAFARRHIRPATMGICLQPAISSERSQFSAGCIMSIAWRRQLSDRLNFCGNTTEFLSTNRLILPKWAIIAAYQPPGRKDA